MINERVQGCIADTLTINITNQDLKLMDHRMNQGFRLKASKEALKELKTILEQEK